MLGSLEAHARNSATDGGLELPPASIMHKPPCLPGLGPMAPLFLATLSQIAKPEPPSYIWVHPQLLPLAPKLLSERVAH